MQPIYDMNNDNCNNTESVFVIADDYLFIDIFTKISSVLYTILLLMRVLPLLTT